MAREAEDTFAVLGQMKEMLQSEQIMAGQIVQLERCAVALERIAAVAENFIGGLNSTNIVNMIEAVGKERKSRGVDL